MLIMALCFLKAFKKNRNSPQQSYEPQATFHTLVHINVYKNHEPSPSHHHVFRWYGYHSQMGYVIPTGEHVARPPTTLFTSGPTSSFFRGFFGRIISICLKHRLLFTDYLPTSASISINQHQSASISINQHQSASISINQHQSTSISINQHQSVNTP